MNMTIRLQKSEERGPVTKQLKNLIDYYDGVDFNIASLCQEEVIPNDPQNDAYYPLILYASKSNLRVMIPEVRMEAPSLASQAMIDCLKIAGFNVKKSTITAIHTKRKMYIWKEDQIKQVI